MLSLEFPLSPDTAFLPFKTPIKSPLLHGKLLCFSWLWVVLVFLLIAMPACSPYFVGWFGGFCCLRE